MEIKKIILLASERSGTNLLRTLIDNHREICGPVAPHLFDAFHQTLSFYDDLNVKEHAVLLVKHMLQLANHKYHNWELNINEEDLIKKYNVNSIEMAFNALYTEKAKQSGKIHYVSKDNHLFKYTDYLKKLENVKYVYLYRDPRDHVASWMKTPIFMHTPYDVIVKWKKEQEIILNFATKEHVHFVSYEELISDTPRIMTSLLEFFEVSVDERCFNTNSENQESKRNTFWKNLSQPIIKNNTKKYLNNLTIRDIKIIESIAKPIMQKLNYQLDTSGDWKAYKGFGYELKLKRAVSKYNNRELIHKEMSDLQDKIRLIESLKKTIKNDYSN